MLGIKRAYLQAEDESENKITVFPITDVNSVIGLGNSKGDLLDQIKSLDERLTALEKKVNYH